MTRESLEKKIAELEAQREQLLASANAVNGAIIFASQLLQELESGAEAASAPASQKE